MHVTVSGFALGVWGEELPVNLFEGAVPAACACCWGWVGVAQLRWMMMVSLIGGVCLGAGAGAAPASTPSDKVKAEKKEKKEKKDKKVSALGGPPPPLSIHRPPPYAHDTLPAF